MDNNYDRILFSIVIPVYNVEKYIQDCIESIIPQIQSSNSRSEILLIDDGSTDSSGKICDEIKKLYPNYIKIFHKENEGLLATRRFGYQRALGEYIINCDSDDLLELGMIRSLENAIKKYNSPDIIVFNYYRYESEKSKKIVKENIFTVEKECFVSKDEILKEFMRGHNIVSLCGKVVNRSCIDIYHNYESFGKLSTGEDTLQSIEFFSTANTFLYLNEAFYDYRRGSGMTSKFDSNYYFTFKVIFEEIQKKKNSWMLNDFESLFAIKVLQTAGRAITQSRFADWKSFHEQKDYLKKIRNDKMLIDNLVYLQRVAGFLQKDHYILLKLFEKRFYNLVCLLLRIKNLEKLSSS